MFIRQRQISDLTRVATRALALLVALCGVALAQQSSASQLTKEPTTKAATLTASTETAQPQPVQSADSSLAPQALPPPVVAVVHRLSGWQLRASVAPPDAAFVAPFDDKFVRTNIVAGYVLPDGRTVVARLPQTDADALSFAFFPEELNAPTPAGSTLKLVRADGREFDARFIGLDGSTGLSLFEASAQLLPPTKEATQTLSVGQRVSVWAPLPSGAPTGELSTTLAPSAASTRHSELVVGDEGVLYMNLGKIEGTLREVKRSPVGRALAFNVETGDASPEWAGGVALSVQNGLIGIVEQNEGRAKRLLPAETVRAAAARVRARRASVPQPWLGVRGDAVAQASPDLFVSRGWSREQAATLVRRQQGVVLTSVAPDSPAARAGLRAGDVIARVGDEDVRGIEDMTLMLREVGGNSPAEFKVWRAGATPLTVRVLLSEAQNPAAATARSEVFVAESSLTRARAEAEQRSVELSRLSEELNRLQRTALSGTATTAESRAAEEKVRAVRERLRSAEESLRQDNLIIARYEQEAVEARTRLRLAASASPAIYGNPLLQFGVETRVFMRTTVTGGVTQRLRGLLVVGVRDGGAAFHAGLRAGDVIETINDQPSIGVDLKSTSTHEDSSPIALAVTRDGKKIKLVLNPSEK